MKVFFLKKSVQVFWSSFWQNPCPSFCPKFSLEKNFSVEGFCFVKFFNKKKVFFKSYLGKFFRKKFFTKSFLNVNVSRRAKMKMKQPVVATEPPKNGLKVNECIENCVNSDLHNKNGVKSKKKKAKQSKNKLEEVRSNQTKTTNQNTTEPSEATDNDKNDPKELIDKQKHPLRVKASPYEFDLNKEPQTIDEMLTEIKKLFNNFLMGNVEESKYIFYQRAHVSFFYEIICCSFDFLDSLLHLDKENLEIALQSVNETNISANKLRKKMGFMGYLIRGDFSQHTDMELYAEAAHSFTQVLNGFIVALLDQGIYGIVNGGIKAKISYSSLKNCMYALEDKKQWESSISQRNYESLIRTFIGVYDLVVSFCPSKIARVLDLIGFNSDRVVAMANVRKAFEIKDTCINEFSLVMLMIYHLFLNFHFGIGDTDVKFICEATKRWDNVPPKETFIIFGKGSKHMVLGSPKQGIELFEIALRTKGHFRQVNFLCYWQLTWSHAMMANWAEAARYSGYLKEECNWSRALFHYMYAIFLQHQMDLEGKKELKETIEENLSVIPKIKRTIGGKLAFHEKLVLTKSKHYVNKSEEMVLPAFDLMYVWNNFNMMANNPELFTPMMELVEAKLAELKKSQVDKKDEKSTDKKDGE